MEQYKGALSSKAVWGGIIAILASVAAIWGFKVSPDDQARLADIAIAIASGVGGIMAIWGRVTATKKIGKA